MPTQDSLKQSMDRAVKRYSSLFRLPSDRKVLLLLAFSTMVGGLSSAAVLQWSINGVIMGLLLGFTLFLVGSVVDYITNSCFLKRDTLYNLRRTIALSLFSWIVWLFFVFIGVIAASATTSQQWWLRLCLLGYSSTMIFRLVVFSSTASMSQVRVLLVSLLHPSLCTVLFLVLWSLTGNVVTWILPLFVLFSIGVGVGATAIFLHFLDRLGKKSLGMRSMTLFRAFMLNWVLDLNVPFEQLLETLGEKRNVETCFAKFSSSKSNVVLVVPSVHPGPFKNIGSSLLPSQLKAKLESSLGCVACVPHGLLGHEFDLASQQQNLKVIDSVIKAVDSTESSEGKASPFVKVSNGLATACCQIFGSSAIISFTLAPRTIEDLPEELGLFVRDAASKRGLDLCAIVNAHNSIDGATEVEGSLVSLRQVADECLEKVASLHQASFEVGAATIWPRYFTLEDGMGSGGVTVVVVKCVDQKAAYVVIDGNNMVSGFREEILASLKELGIDDGEIFTTDTHSVSALVLGGQGYHPVGEVMDHGRLIGCIREATLAALAKLVPAKAACQRITVNDVTVLGARQLESLCLLIDKSLHTAKKIVAPVFFGAGLMLMLFLLFV